MSGSPLLLTGVVILAVFLAIGLGAPWLAPYDPNEQLDAVAGRHRPPLTVMAAVEFGHGVWRLADDVERTDRGLRITRLGREQLYDQAEILNLDEHGVRDRRIFLLGSDKFGRDILSRLIHAARVSLMIGILSVLLSSLVGITVGALAALCGSFSAPAWAPWRRRSKMPGRSPTPTSRIFRTHRSTPMPGALSPARCLASRWSPWMGAFTSMKATAWRKSRFPCA